ncbi:tRNA lysidine(34) synthetase TilS [Sandaracinobacteroides hominis]|uniref:tRNA lysidine(34) synthetase TilS n=1 Tax=Sandaracinobacteroides hominis TaxID=2780086 RepID=UPI0018F5CA60|nr:tRNA lysidine(34) synthetase TilS [Sandaracinobacteroides hominis]
MAAERLTPELFAAEVRRLAGPQFGNETPMALAVSGGPDSLALLWLAARAFPQQAHVLSVDHGLRAEAAAECAMVAMHARSMGLPHTSFTLAMQKGASLQAEARGARYGAMGNWCRANGIGLLLTAHHLDDQAETVLLRLARGSGPGGLAGIRRSACIAGVCVLRPLLGWRRAELAEVVRKAGWEAVSDPSNSDPRYDRTAARALLAATDWLHPERLAASTEHLAEAEAALGWAAERAWESRVVEDGDALLIDPEALPAELRRRLLARAVEQLGVPAEGPPLARLLATLDGGGTATLSGVQARYVAGRWQLSRAAPRRH